jgi:uncharacterized membrane protein (UPF0182 family)
MKRIVLAACGFLVIGVIWATLTIYPDWLWFENLHFSRVFWTMVLSKVGLGAAIWIVFCAIVSLCLLAAGYLSKKSGDDRPADMNAAFLTQLGISRSMANLLFIALVLAVSIFVASSGSAQWKRVLSYFFQQPFGSTDPIFQKNIAFYVFSLPFYLFIQEGLLAIVFLSGILALVWYLKTGMLQISPVGQPLGDENRQAGLPKISMQPSIMKLLIFLGGILVLLLAWGFYLKMFELLYSTAGAAFGAGYSDVHIKRLAYMALIPVSVAFAVVLFANVFRTRARLIWISGGIWVAAALVLSNLVPILVQKVVVKPNELTKESPYIAYNIEYTRTAYNLNKIKEVDFPVGDQLTSAQIKAHKTTIQNVRIWDKRPLLQTYKQLQSIRLYYGFKDVDVDRYQIDNEYRQVMLSARELVASQLPRQAKTWVNRHLIYTHGYGLALNTVSDVTAEGLPRLLIKDLPPVIDVDLKIVHPAIYYGEMTADYVLVNTKAKEFDYPKGDANVYTHYTGVGGIPLNSFVRRVLYALEFLDPQILFTNYLGSESRIMYTRRIDRRVRAIAPFLDYDGDPYLVISDEGLKWVVDAYTTSAMYPYSQRTSGYFHKSINYIRNSVKITVDAYNGDVSFYIIDDKDPIVRTYARMFPRLFKPFKEMPAGLQKHIRYPRDLFSIQANTYRIYHMKNVKVFYNQEDLWQLPDEIYGDQRQQMQPYYIIVRLPGESTEEFLLMLPFTPSGKDNMISWLAARNDMPSYGSLIVYKLSKEKLAFGPMQIEARIDQQTNISQELTLWGQRGSKVIRGNLLAIPIDDTFIYVEPVYLEAKPSETDSAAQQSARPRDGSGARKQAAGRTSRSERPASAALPELKRVIVSFSNRLAMEKNLDAALFSVLGKQDASIASAGAPMPPSLEGSGTAQRALEHYNRAKTYLREGDWAGYGRELNILEEMLNEMAGKRKEKQ